MGKGLKIRLIVALTIGILLNLVVIVDIKIEQYQAKALFRKARDHNKIYVYEKGPLGINPALYVDDPKDTLALINYYERALHPDSPAYFNFPIKLMPLSSHVPIYVFNYLKKGSKVVEVIDFNVKCWGYVKGYVYVSTTHPTAPADILVNQWEAAVARSNPDPGGQIKGRIMGGLNPYGWYCQNN